MKARNYIGILDKTMAQSNLTDFCTVLDALLSRNYIGCLGWVNVRIYISNDKPNIFLDKTMAQSNLNDQSTENQPIPSFITVLIFVEYLMLYYLVTSFERKERLQALAT